MFVTTDHVSHLSGHLQLSVSAYPASSTSHSEDSPIHLPTTYHLLNNPDQVSLTPLQRQNKTWVTHCF